MTALANLHAVEVRPSLFAGGWDVLIVFPEHSGLDDVEHTVVVGLEACLANAVAQKAHHEAVDQWLASRDWSMPELKLAEMPDAPA